MAYPAPKLPESAIAMIMCISILMCSSVAAASVHDLLPLYKLPKGLLPREINSTCLSNTDDSFAMELSAAPCYVRYRVVNNDPQVVYFDKIVKGKLGSGKVRAVSGIMAKKFFVWVSVKGIDVDEENGMLEFHAVPFSQKFPAKDFESIHSCNGKEVKEHFSVVEAAATLS